MLIKVSYHSAKFGGHRKTGSGNIRAFVFNVSLQEEVIKESNNFWLGAPYVMSPIYQVLLAVDTVAMEL